MEGSLKYLRFIIRRECVISSLWIGFTVIFTFLIAAMFPSLLGDDLSRIAMIEMLKSPAMVGMLGPVYGSEAYTEAISFAQMMTVWVMVTAAAMNIFFINRHTRTDEEQGRLEMLRSLPVGKLSNSIAAITGAFILNILMAFLTSIAIIIVDFEGCTLIGAAAYSFEIGAFGFLMAAITLLCAQLYSTSRGANGAAFAVLGVFYLMRIAGDYNDTLISYISPMGLGLRVFAFHENNLYPVFIQLLQTAVFIIISLMICARRDVGEGVIPAKKGGAHAKKNMLSPLGFTVYLTKTTAFVWCIVVFIVAAMYGSMLGDIDSFIENNEFFRDFLSASDGTAGTLTDNFMAILFMIMAHIAVIPVIGIAGKTRSEENRGRLEQIFARAVKRSHLLGSFAAIAFIESILTLFFTATGLYAAGIGIEALEFGNILKSAMCYLPAMWTFAAISIFLTGFLPKCTGLVWALYAYSFAVVYLGRMLELPDIFMKFSPFGVIPQMPVQDFNILPLAVLTLLTALLVTLGIWRFNERDVGS